MDPAAEHLAPLLGRLTNYERLRPNRPRWSLANMRALLDRAGARLPPGPLVQVGGSKGKGTTCLYMESLAQAVGLSTGSYLSPHLETLLERVRVDSQTVALNTLERVLRPILAHGESQGLKVTFFEVMTAAALECFAEQAVDLGLLEVGLGGRLDATTAVPVQAGIVTGIELEHTGILGTTLESIAGEKAYVLRPERPAFTAAQGVALAVLEDHATRVGARLQVLGRDFHLRDVEDAGDGFRGVVATADGTRHRFRLPGASRFELRSFALGLTCLDHLFPERSWPLDPVPRPPLPGRFEVLSSPDRQPLVVDVAHTGESATALRAEIERRYPGSRLTVLFACGAEKRWQACLRALLPLADRFFVTTLVGTASAEPALLLDWLAGQGVRAEAVPDAEGGLRALLGTSGVRLVTGSFYLVGAVRSLVREQTET
jgi:dihydrofolate synthase/folylpolyglutamate synthase